MQPDRLCLFLRSTTSCSFLARFLKGGLLSKGWRYHLSWLFSLAGLGSSALLVWVSLSLDSSAPSPVMYYVAVVVAVAAVAVPRLNTPKMNDAVLWTDLTTDCTSALERKGDSLLVHNSKQAQVGVSVSHRGPTPQVLTSLVHSVRILRHIFKSDTRHFFCALLLSCLFHVSW